MARRSMDEKAHKPAGQEPHQPEEEVEGDSSEQQEISEDQLENILQQHQLYLDSGGEQGEKARLEQANLSGAHRPEVDLRKANLRGANLKGANLGNANLQETILQDSSLQGAFLSRANLWRAYLESADLSGAYLFDAKLQEARLHDANLRKAKLEGVDLSLANLFKADLRETNLQEANLHEANLENAKLEEVDLRGANLKRANLHGANLQGAKLENVNLRGAFLYEAKLQGASLVRADLQGAEFKGADLEAGVLKKDSEPDIELAPADLTHANLRNADLSDAKLSGVIGLLSGKLAGANLSNAKIPEDIAKFEGVAHVAEISKHARTNFLAVIGGCVFSWLTIAMTTDVALVTGSSATPLPIIQTKVPINGFYWAAPLILLALYFYLHLYLQRMWEGLARLPAVFPDGRTLDQTAYPWLLSGLVWAHTPLLRDREDRPSLSKLQVGLSILAAWVTVPTTIFLFWFRYLPRHEWIGTGLLIVALLVATWSGIAFYRRARATLRGDDLIAVAKRPIKEGAFTSLAALIIGTLSYLAIDGPFGLYLFNYGLYAEMPQADISTKPANWTGLPFPSKDNPLSTAEEKSQAEWAQVKGARLSGANLRYAYAPEAFLAKANLRGANLRGASLQEANLQGADLTDADLRRAKLGLADLQGAHLIEANLQGADLTWANLGQATLMVADLQGANLLVTFLQGANLQGVNHLTQEQLDQACGDENTKLPEGLTIKPCEKEEK